MTVPVPRPASTVVVVRDATVPEILMVRRAQGQSFFGGAYVFPGGRVDAADRADEAGLWCDGVEAARDRFPALAAGEALAYHVAAVRELFEEAGVLLARGPDGGTVRVGSAEVQARYDAHRHAVHAGKATLRDVIEAERLRLALDLLLPFAHWITPTSEPKRFDARFFVARMPEGQRPMHDAGETTEAVWVAATEALARCARDEIVLAPPTWRTLWDLARQADVDAIFAWASRQTIGPIQPMPHEEAGRQMLLLPGDPLNPAPFPGEAAPETRFILDDKGRWRAARPGDL